MKPWIKNKLWSPFNQYTDVFLCQSTLTNTLSIQKKGHSVQLLSRKYVQVGWKRGKNWFLMSILTLETYLLYPKSWTFTIFHCTNTSTKFFFHFSKKLTKECFHLGMVPLLWFFFWNYQNAYTALKIKLIVLSFCNHLVLGFKVPLRRQYPTWSLTSSFLKTINTSFF